MQKTTINQKVQYYFENRIFHGPTSLIKWLALISLFIVLLFGLLIFIFGISAEPSGEGLSFIEGAWKSLMATLDPGTMGGDEGWSYRIIRFLSTIAGIFVISILIGSISNGIDQFITKMKKGKSKVLESNHTLILGWNEKIFTIISEISIANENQKGQKIVILANKDKEEMEDEIQSKILNTRNTKIIVRSGNPLDAYDISIANPNNARSIIILNDENANSPDIQTIKTVLSITNSKNRKSEKYNIIAEIKDETNIEAAELVGSNEATYILTSDLISRVIAQTCLQSGLSVVYSQLFQFEGDEIYFKDEPTLIGKTFKDALFAYETSSVIGIFSADKKAKINPEKHTIINKGDKIIAISEDDDTIILSNKTEYSIKSDLINNSFEINKESERTLILGWNYKGIKIIQEIDNYVGKGSEVVIISQYIEIEELNNLKQQLKNINVFFQEGNITQKKNIENIKPETFNHIIVLSYQNDDDIQETDAHTLICLIHLRNIAERLGKDFKIVSEMLDIRNREIGEVAKADDFIVSDNLLSLMLSQVSENKEMKNIYDDFFDTDGSEIYLRPVSKYVKTGEKLNFYTVVESASQYNEVAFGYRKFSEKNNSALNFGVFINPDKSKEIVFDKNDKIIVFAED